MFSHDERDFEFCTKYGIPIVPVIRPVDGELPAVATEAYGEYGIVENSGEWSGLASAARAASIARMCDTTSIVWPMRSASCAVAVAYETVQLPSGELPLLTPMSEVAGRMAVQEGAKYLEKVFGGSGILLGGVPGVAPAHVVILGAGIVGTNPPSLPVTAERIATLPAAEQTAWREYLARSTAQRVCKR